MTYSLRGPASEICRDAREIRESSKSIGGGRTASELSELARKMALVTVAARQRHFCQGRCQAIDKPSCSVKAKSASCRFRRESNLFSKAGDKVPTAPADTASYLCDCNVPVQPFNFAPGPPNLGPRDSLQGRELLSQDMVNHCKAAFPIWQLG
jgi:hypothetical protein